MDDKKQWTLNTVKAFYKEVEKRFGGIKTEKEAVEVFKGMFSSEREFYKHLNKHILKDIYNDKQHNWILAKQKDEQFNQKFSREYLQLFINYLKPYLSIPTPA